MAGDRSYAPTMGIYALIDPLTPVAVRCHFDGSWVEGFAVADVAPEGPAPYAIRRLSDGAQLPVRFRPDEVRPASW